MQRCYEHGGVRFEAEPAIYRTRDADSSLGFSRQRVRDSTSSRLSICTVESAALRTVAYRGSVVST